MRDKQKKREVSAKLPLYKAGRKIDEAGFPYESERLLRTIIDTEPECVKLLSRDGSLILMNPAGLAMIQADSLDLVKGKSMSSVIVPEYREAFIALTEDVFKGKSGKLEFEIVGIKGRRLWLETHAVPLRDDNNEITALLGITRDVTERKLAEDALRRSEELVRNIIDNVDAGFLVIAQDLKVLMANRTYCKWLGLSCDDVIGRHCHEITHKSLKPCYEEGERCAVSRAFQSGLPQTVAHTHEDAAGNIMHVEIKAYPLKNASGGLDSVIVAIEDLTQQRFFEEERLKTQKLEALGTLAGGIAHDFNNLLQSLFGYISLAKDHVGDAEKAVPMLDQAEKALHLTVNLTNQLLTFSKGGKPVKKMTAIQPLIEDATKFALSGSRSDFRLDVEEGLWAIEVDDGQLSQVIQNIVLNAEQSMPGGGTVTITARNAQRCPEALPVAPSRGRCLDIAISDIGVGIPEEHLTKIFDPYFTTKKKGSGLGLATSYSIVRNHGGLIRVESELNKGSTFHIFLPVTGRAVRMKESLEHPPFARQGRILVMDDEDDVRMVVRDMLIGSGHEVDVAENGTVAIEKYKEGMDSGHPYDVVILDITVRGGMGGEETIRKLRDLDPGVNAVVTSGYSDSVVLSEYASYGFKAYLSKPFKKRELQVTVSNMLCPTA